MRRDGARFAGAADHAEELKWTMNPGFEDESVVFVAARDDEAKGWHGSERRGEDVAPSADVQRNVRRENVVVRQFGAIIKNADSEIELVGEGSNRLGDV